MSDLLARADDAFAQLMRYSGAPDERVLAVIEELVEINDDLKHARHPDLIRADVSKAKKLLDKILGD